MTRSLRSIRTRWTIALVAVCVLEAVLVAVAVRVSTARAFERFLVEESLVGFAEDVAQAIEESGSIEAIRPRRAGAGGRPPGGLPPRAGVGPRPPAGGPPAAGQPPSRPPPGGGRRLDSRLPPGGGPAGAPVVRFGLADADGRVVLPFDGHPVGAVLPTDVLADGRPIRVDGAVVGTALIPTDAAQAPSAFGARSPEARFLRASSAALLWALAGSLALALGLGVWLAGRTARPLRDLTAAARRIADGDLRQTVAVETADEVGTLATAFNAMSARLDTATALRRRMTADVSHDLRTPLTAVLGTLEAIQTGALPATPERLATVYAEAQRLGRLIDDLHTLALADADELSVHTARVDPAQALRRVAHSVEAEARAADVTVAVDPAPAPPVAADPDRLSQILGNLVANALRHTPAGGTITLSARPAAEGVALSVADTGAGMAPDVLAVVFERAVRGDAARSGEGAGLGLSIVRSLAQAQGGTATATSELGVGTTVTVTLPAWTDAR
ncbi:ATP-binding protein [Rubrivirga sp. IMCC45206]|uniref:sensor histidine kinase n=1 Tax=Rubrivirga sp. IMCC45206 TaxID=3391614 RepID=UPI00398FAFEC